MAFKHIVRVKSHTKPGYAVLPPNLDYNLKSNEHTHNILFIYIFSYDGVQLLVMFTYKSKINVE